MKETEIKLQYDPAQHQELLRRCAALGFTPEDQVWEEDIYYTPAHKNLIQCDQALRLRLVRSDTRGAHCRITYKGPNQATGLHAREELETEVADGGIVKTILERLDFTRLATVEKRRLYFVRADAHICVDQVSGLGHYFEVELLDARDAQAQVLALAEALSVPGVRSEPRTYLELILQREGGGSR